MGKALPRKVLPEYIPRSTITYSTLARVGSRRPKEVP